MSNLTGRPPPPMKGEKPPKARYKGINPVSAKRLAHWASQAGKKASEYMRHLKQLPCCICGRYGVDGHHCKDTPPAGEPSPYKGTPGSRNHFDAIPLCPNECHNFGPRSFHKNRKAWRERNGPDYSYIPATREAVKALMGEVG